MNTAVIIKIGEYSEKEKPLKRNLEEFLCGYLKENFEELLEVDRRDVQYSIDVFLNRKWRELCEEAQIENPEKIPSYMIVAADWKKNRFISVQWGKGSIYAEGNGRWCVISSPCHRETLKEAYGRIRNHDLDKVCIRRGDICGINRFRLENNEEKCLIREEIIERKTSDMLY